jgi:hypothetical protein
LPAPFLAAAGLIWSVTAPLPDMPDRLKEEPSEVWLSAHGLKHFAEAVSLLDAMMS